MLSATLPYGRTPPVLTDYLGAGVGGVLSAGGLGGATHRHGLVADQVLELAVVTGAGEHRVCSPGRDPELWLNLQCPTTPAGWRSFVDAKRRHDPCLVLGRGHGLRL